MCGSDEPRPYPEKGSPSRLSTSGHISYKRRSCILRVCETSVNCSQVHTAEQPRQLELLTSYPYDCGCYVRHPVVFMIL